MGTGWLLGILVGLILALCKPLFDALIGVFTFITIYVLSVFEEGIRDVFSCDMTTFNNMFPAIGKTETVIVSMATALCALICLWQIFKSMWGNIVDETEEVWKVVIRTAVCMLLILNSHSLCNMFLHIGNIFYKSMNGAYTVQSWKALFDKQDFVTETPIEYLTDTFGGEDFLGGLETVVADFVKNLLAFVLLIPVAYNYVKLILEVAERYIVLAFLTYTAPLALAMGTSKSTANIMKSWGRMYGSAILMMIFNAWTLGLFRSAMGNLASNAESMSYLTVMILLFAFLKAAQRLDSYMSSMGISVAQTGGSLLDDMYGSFNSLSSIGGAMKGIGGAVAKVASAPFKVAGAAKGAFLGTSKNGSKTSNNTSNTSTARGTNNGMGGNNVINGKPIANNSNAGSTLKVAADNAKRQAFGGNGVSQNKVVSFGKTGTTSQFNSGKPVNLVGGDGKMHSSVPVGMDKNNAFMKAMKRDFEGKDLSNITYKGANDKDISISSFAPKNAFASDINGNVLGDSKGMAFDVNGNAVDSNTMLRDADGNNIGTVGDLTAKYSGELQSASTTSSFDEDALVNVDVETGTFDTGNNDDLLGNNDAYSLNDETGYNFGEDRIGKETSDEDLTEEYVNEIEDEDEVEDDFDEFGDDFGETNTDIDEELISFDENTDESLYDATLESKT